MGITIFQCDDCKIFTSDVIFYKNDDKGIQQWICATCASNVFDNEPDFYKHQEKPRWYIEKENRGKNESC